MGNYYYGTTTAPAGPGQSFVNSTISGPVTVYEPLSTGEIDLGKVDAKIFPNPVSDLLVVQSTTAKSFDRKAEVVDMNGKIIDRQTIQAGSTMCYFYLDVVLSGSYIVRVSSDDSSATMKVEVVK